MFRKDMLKKLFVVAVLVSLLCSDVVCVFHVVEPAYAAKKKSTKKKSVPSKNSARVELIRNKMYYNIYSAEAGYRPVGKQLERFFSNWKWTTEKTDDEFYGNQRAVFRGLGVVKGGRRVIFSVIFIQRPNNGELVLLEVLMNGQRAYSLVAEQANSLGFNSELWMAAFGGKNQFTLRDFIDYIYSRE